MAALSRFCVFWIKKTIRKVTMVVAVLMTNCQVSLYPNRGPVSAHTIMAVTAAANDKGCPMALEDAFENRPNIPADVSLPRTFAVPSTFVFFFMSLLRETSLRG